MNKQTYLSELSGQLKLRGVEDIDEIIAEYDIHFTRKTADGYTEEEVAAKLGKPKEIALQFTPADSKAEKKKSGKFLSVIGLVFADLFVIPYFVVMYAWMAVIGAISLASAALGITLIIRPLLPVNPEILPPMPYPGGVLMAVMLLAFAVLAAAGAIYFGALTGQMGRSYRRWHKNVMNDGKYPPYSMHPVLNDRMRRKLRSIGLIALFVFGAAFIIGYIVLVATAGALEFWHVWNWFV